MLAIYIGKCRKCSHTSRAHVADVQTYDSATGRTYTGHKVDTARPFRAGNGPFAAKCPTHGVYPLRALQGRTVETIKCDARCTGAHGPKCDCSCGGKNHGADHG